MREIDPLTELAYRFAEQQAVGQSDQGAAVEDKWHVSFHGSQFPGNGERACGRQALYRLMDTPRTFGSYLFSNRKLTQIADAGKDIEDRLVMKWHNAGFLVSTPPFDALGNRQSQDQFEDREAWLTSTVDSIVLWPRIAMPVVCEIKSKYATEIEKMLRLYRGPDERHIKQLKTQIAMVRHDALENPRKVLRCYNTDRLAIPQVALLPPGMLSTSGLHEVRDLCPEHRTEDCLYECELVPPEYGFLYYVSRDNPIDTWEFYFEYDAAFYDAGVEKLKQWRQSFQNGLLPQSNFVDKRYAHPYGWKWTEQPCKWCDYGDECRKDTKTAIAKGEEILLRESEAAEEAKTARPDYDFDLVQAAVEERWVA